MGSLKIRNRKEFEALPPNIRDALADFASELPDIGNEKEPGEFIWKRGVPDTELLHGALAALDTGEVELARKLIRRVLKLETEAV